MTTSPSTVVSIAEQVGQGNETASNVVSRYLKACAERSHLNALTYVATDEASRRAEEIDALVESGKPAGRLCGVPVLVKDAICTRGVPTTAGSNILKRHAADGRIHAYLPPYDATVIERLEAEGAIVLGKTNMDEFAMGSSNETSSYGPVKNPWDESRIPGGSSGGSAAAVAADMAPVALGSDTGGSIRQPASLCGVVGVKPTYGRVSRYGLIAFASSLDQIGPMTPDVKSAARLLEVMAGFDPRDSTSGTAPVGKYEAACEQDVHGMTFGLPEEYFAEGLDERVRAVVEKAAAKLESAGARVRPVRLPHTHYGIATYYVVATAEASSNLSRFDGIRYGLREEPSGADLATVYRKTRAHGFGDEVKRRILLGTYVLSAGYYDAYYKKAQRVRSLIQKDFADVFSQVDALITPASPSPAFRFGEKLEDPLSMYMADVYTLPASLAGISGISVPGGTAEVEGKPLPVGIQILGPALGEETVFRAAAGLERAVDGV